MLRIGVVVVALVCSVGGLVGAQEALAQPRPQSPQELIDAYQRCYDPATKRFSKRQMVALCSEDSVFLLFPRCSGEAGYAAKKAGAAAQAELDAILRRHGLDPATKPLEPELSDADQMALFTEPKRAVTLCKRLLRDVRDPRAFIGDLFEFIATHLERVDAAPVSVEELVVDGERARGVLHELTVSDGGRSRMESQVPFHMLREGGRWTYDLLAFSEELAANMREGR